MKKSFVKVNILVVLIALVTTIFVVFLTSCGGGGKMANEMYAKYDNLAEGQRISLRGGEGERATATIDLGESKNFNTVVLSESSKSVLMFNIFASNDADATTFKHIYEGDTIEDYRACFVGNVNYRYIRVDVVSSTGKYNVNDIKVYNNINEGSKKRVTSYFLIDRIITDIAPDASEADKYAYDHQFDALDTITDLIMFTWTRFDENGNVMIYMEDNAKSTPGNVAFYPQDEAKEIYRKRLNLVKDAVAKVEANQGRDIIIYIEILMPWGVEGDANYNAREIMKDGKRAHTIESINAFIDEFGFDGVDLDYEYPYTREEVNLFNTFLVDLKASLKPNIKLTTAIGAWNCALSKEAIDAVDMINLMTYDMFDSHGYHAGFNSCMISDLNKMISKGVPAEKITLGLPFYSRPINKGGYWGDYFRFYNEGLITNKYMNIVHSYPTADSGNWPLNDPEYFNGPQMIEDKTAFAIDAPVAGVMIWHYHCDIDYNNDMSLFRAIKKTFDAKKASLA